MSYSNDIFCPPCANIKVIGIGGGGGNAVNTMIKTEIEGVDFITANTDIQSLKYSLASTKIQLGQELTKGLGAGANPDIGRDAALEDRAAIQNALEGANMVFITAGMGGGTGTGGASIVAQIARDLGALTVAVVTKPFIFEGKRRQRFAEIGIERLRDKVDTLITIPNQRLLQIARPDLSMMDAFKLADNVLVNAVKGISDIINVPGIINVDFADVKTIMSSTGLALMGIGYACGENRAIEAANQAISSPLLEDVDIEGATGILINITSSANITLNEVNLACSVVQEAAHEDANIIFGAVIDESIGEYIRITVIATGFPSDNECQVSNNDLTHTSRMRPALPASSRGLSTFENSFKNDSFFQKKEPSAPKNNFSENHDYQASKQRAKREYDSAISTNNTSKVDSSSKMPFLSSTFDASELTKFTFNSSSNENNMEKQQLVHKDELTVDRSFGAEFDRDSTIIINKDFDLAPSELSNFNSELTPKPTLADPIIDEALEIVNRLNEVDSMNYEKNSDDLDIPAFLRHGIKDLSLS